MDISLSTFRLWVLIWIGMAIGIFFLLLKIKAPYGRHTSANWGPLLPNHIGWMIMEIPALAIMMYTFISCVNSSFVVEIMIGLFCLHYINRTIIFPFRLHTKGKKIPLMIVLSAVFFNGIDTFFLGYYFAHFSAYPNSYATDPRFIIGLALFFTGMFINWSADNRLIRLRKPGETGYKIPQGWLFSYISCPNMFGELIEWGGFAILCWNLPALAFLVWTMANLLPRALAHHQWYKQKFSDYPAERKAVVPFLV